MHNTMMFFTQRGRCYWLKVYELPEGNKNSKGRAIQNLLNIDSDDSLNAIVRVKTLADSNNIFYENLLREHPNLTKNERKLCLFIHMKMSTKEISNITNQSPGSINVARSRLRQKFGLTGDDRSLIAYLDRFGTAEK